MWGFLIMSFPESVIGKLRWLTQVVLSGGSFLNLHARVKWLCLDP